MKERLHRSGSVPETNTEQPPTHLASAEATYLLRDAAARQRLLTTLARWKRRSSWSASVQQSPQALESPSLPPVMVVRCQSLCFSERDAFETTRREVMALQRLCWPYVSYAHLARLTTRLLALHAPDNA